MEILLIVLQILILVTFVIGYFFVKNLLPSYFSEKGKNIATKEDIEYITEKVKTVESSINILTGNIVDYNSLKRTYILDYFGAYNNWQRTISNNEIDYSKNAKEINNQRLERILEAKHLYNIKEGEIELFISDKEFYQARTDLSIETLKFQQIFEKLSLEIEHINEDNDAKRLDIISEKLKQYRKDKIAFTKSTQKYRNILIIYLENELKKMMEK